MSDHEQSPEQAAIIDLDRRLTTLENWQKAAVEHLAALRDERNAEQAQLNIIHALVEDLVRQASELRETVVALADPE